MLTDSFNERMESIGDIDRILNFNNQGEYQEIDELSEDVVSSLIDPRFPKPMKITNIAAFVEQQKMTKNENNNQQQKPQLSHDELEQYLLNDDKALHDLYLGSLEGQLRKDSIGKGGNKPLTDEQQKLISGTIKMLCKEHKFPAVFYSYEKECYFCFKCLVTS